jgi:hypothetical protein
LRPETTPPEPQSEAQPTPSPARSAVGIEAERFSILKKPISIR